MEWTLALLQLALVNRGPVRQPPGRQPDPELITNTLYHSPTFVFATGWMLVLGLFFLWIYFRINRNRINLVFGSYCLAQALWVWVFFKEDRWPHPFTIVVLLALRYAFYAAMAALLAAVLARRLPYLGINEFNYIYEGEGELRKPFFLGVTALTLVLSQFLFTGTYDLLRKALDNSDFKMFLIFILGIPLVAILGYPLLPWKQLEEVALLGEKAPPRELEFPFNLTGPASRIERVLMPLAGFGAVAAMTFFANFAKTQYDYGGLIIVFMFLSAALFNEITRDKRAAEYDEMLTKLKSKY